MQKLIDFKNYMIEFLKLKFPAANVFGYSQMHISKPVRDKLNIEVLAGEFSNNLETHNSVYTVNANVGLRLFKFDGASGGTLNLALDDDILLNTQNLLVYIETEKAKRAGDDRYNQLFNGKCAFFSVQRGVPEYLTEGDNIGCQMSINLDVQFDNVRFADAAPTLPADIRIEVQTQEYVNQSGVITHDQEVIIT